MTTVTELLQPVETDLETLLGDLRNLIGAGHPILQAAAEHLFSAGGEERDLQCLKGPGRSAERFQDGCACHRH